MHVFMMTYGDVIDKQSLLATPVWERWTFGYLLCRLIETDCRRHFINKNIDKWRQRIEAVVKNNGGHIEHLFK